VHLFYIPDLWESQFLDVSNSGPPISLYPTSSTYPLYPPSHLFIKLLKDLHKDDITPTTLHHGTPVYTLFPSLRTLVAQSESHYDAENTSMEYGRTKGFMLRRAVGDERWLDVIG
jgi:hypothetical protein